MVRLVYYPKDRVQQYNLAKCWFLAEGNIGSVRIQANTKWLQLALRMDQELGINRRLIHEEI